MAGATLDDAVAAGSDGAPSELSDTELAAMVSATCAGLGDDDGDTAEVVSHDLVSAVPATQVEAAAEAIGDGVEVLCPDDVAANPRYLNTLVQFASLSAPSTTEAPTTTAAPTTAPPPPPTTAAPPPPPPPPPPTTAAPPPPPPPSSSTYYANCSEARAAGAAPVHRGDPGYGSHLDRDDDGVGCE